MDAPAAALTRIEYVRGGGAETCPEESIVRAAIVEKLGYDPFTTSRDARALVAEVTGDGKAFRAIIRLVDPAGATLGTRTLVHEGARCEDLAASMALSMSVAIDPAALDGPRTSAARAPEPEKKDQPTPPPPPPVEPAPRAPVHLEAGAAPAVWLGAAPATSIGGSAFVAARYRAMSIGIEGRADLPASRRVSDAFVETSLLLGMLVPCVHASVMELCGIFAIGSIRASSRDVAFPKEAASLHTAAGARAGIELPISRAFWIWAHADALAALTTHKLGLDGAEVYTLPRVSGGLGLGFRVRFL